MNVLVTGIAGFIGAAAARALLARGDRLTGIDNLNDSYDPALKQARLNRLKADFGDHLDFRRIDFADSDSLAGGLAGAQFDHILHLGAQAGARSSLDHPGGYVRSNLVGHANVLELARVRRVSHLVYASTSAVYGANRNLPFRVEDRVDQPLSLYAATKRANELMSESYSKLYGLRATGLRLFTVYGPWIRPDMALWIFTRALFEGAPLPLFNGGEMRRDFTFVDDAVRGTIACLDSPPADDGATKAGGSVSPHAIYNIGNSRSEDLMRVVRLLEQATGLKALLSPEPMHPADVRETFADISAVERDHGFRPQVAIDEGIPLFVDWYRRYHAL